MTQEGTRTDGIWKADEFEKAFQTAGLFMDESRERFKTYHCGVLQRMVNGRMERVNRFRQLLLGPKGMGKTVLMETLGRAAEVAGDVIVVQVDYSAPASAKSPFELALPKLPADLRTEIEERIHDKSYDDDKIALYSLLNAELFRQRRVLLFLVDELENIYTAACSRGSHLVEHLAVIGGVDGRAIHCILSGSGSNVRKLAFCKLDDDLKKDYPNYKGVDLNCTRFAPFNILPFTASLQEFHGAVSHLCSISSVSTTILTDEYLRNLLIASGGNPGCLLQALMGSTNLYDHG